MCVLAVHLWIGFKRKNLYDIYCLMFGLLHRITEPLFSEFGLWLSFIKMTENYAKWTQLPVLISSPVSGSDLNIVIYNSSNLNYWSFNTVLILKLSWILCQKTEIRSFISMVGSVFPLRLDQHYSLSKPLPNQSYICKQYLSKINSFQGARFEMDSNKIWPLKILCLEEIWRMNSERPFFIHK